MNLHRIVPESETDFNTLSRNLGQSKDAGPVEGTWATRRTAAKRQDAARVRLLTACCTSPRRIRRPEGAAGTASDGPRPAAPADVRLRLLAVASPAVLFFSRTAQKSEEPRACLPSAASTCIEDMRVRSGRRAQRSARPRHSCKERYRTMDVWTPSQGCVKSLTPHWASSPKSELRHFVVY